MQRIRAHLRTAVFLLALITILAGTLVPAPIAIATDEAPPGEGGNIIGPGLSSFPPGYNPLTGLPVTDPANLELPAVLTSITNFPVSARPQAGTSFAPYIFELYISNGMTRFLSLFYGDYPEIEIPVSGDCPIREEPFVASGLILGNYVWHDENGDGLQNFDEGPVSGVCVNLYNAETDELLESTSTDSNGYYGFNIQAEQPYYLKFVQPTGMTFTQQDLGDDDFADSDADPDTGLTPPINVTGHAFGWDVGFIGEGNPADLDGGEGGANNGSGDSSGENQSDTTTSSSEEITTTNSDFTNPGTWVGNWIEDLVIGPVRSGRLPYKWIRNWFSWSCLIYAGKSEEVDIPGCASVFGSDESDINSAFLSVTRLKEIAEQSKAPGQPIDYSGNTYHDLAPSSGQYDGPLSQGLSASGDANEVLMFYNFYNQALWRFDPLSGGYLRYTDLADGSGMFYSATDRLNGRQLIFHNVIVLFAQHNALTPTIIDINLEYTEGPAILFRDGKAYKIAWRTFGSDPETGRQQPIRFVDENGNPVPLHPGQTWVHMVTYTSQAWEQSPGKWKVRFYAPPGTE